MTAEVLSVEAQREREKELQRKLDESKANAAEALATIVLQVGKTDTQSDRKGISDEDQAAINVSFALGLISLLSEPMLLASQLGRSRAIDLSGSLLSPSRIKLGIEEGRKNKPPSVQLRFGGTTITEENSREVFRTALNAGSYSDRRNARAFAHLTQSDIALRTLGVVEKL